MKERPILFNGDMVRAILAGTKTQTRRVIKLQPTEKPRDVFPEGGFWMPVNYRTEKGRWGFMADLDKPEFWQDDCPFGERGDRLWVRETFAEHDSETDYGSGGLVYRADLPDEASNWTWTPSIHMPRWASRITLEITGVRVERLHAISFPDCRAEGADPTWWEFVNPCPEPGCTGTHHGEKWHFRKIWESTGGNWAANPWVWVIEFQKIGDGKKGLSCE